MFDLINRNQGLPWMHLLFLFEAFFTISYVLFFVFQKINFVFIIQADWVCLFSFVAFFIYQNQWRIEIYRMVGNCRCVCQHLFDNIFYPLVFLFCWRHKMISRFYPFSSKGFAMWTYFFNRNYLWKNWISQI